MAPHPQQGFFLIEALIAILIFALGVLGLVALGGTAISSQSDAQYRTEASSLADAIVGEIQLNVDRTTPLSLQTSLAAYAHNATTASNCVFSGSPTTNVSVLTLTNKAANVGGVGLPGASTGNQQILVDTVNFNRVEVTLCWKTASDTVLRRHTLVSYVN